jgi:hypothetical protein
MGSIVHIKSQLNTERTYLRPYAVFRLIERGEPVPLGDPGEHRWAIPSAITVVEKEDDRDDGRGPGSLAPPAIGSSTPSATRRVRLPAPPLAVP